MLELRPALGGFYGIPQVTRILFASLVTLPAVEVSGLLQMSIRRTLGGTPSAVSTPTANDLHAFSQTVMSLGRREPLGWAATTSDWLSGIVRGVSLRWRGWSGRGEVSLRYFDPRHFEDFIWRILFERSLPPSERERVVRRAFRVCAEPWRELHASGIERARFLGRPAYPRLRTDGLDVFIAQTPYPGRVSPGTKLVVHYHDAIPVLMPHTIGDRAFHEASHFNALAANVRDGAHFVCVSDATRRDLLSLFPEAEPRTVTIHNMLPAHYYPAAPEPERVAGIVHRYQFGEFRHPHARKGERAYRLARHFGEESEKTAFYEHAFDKEARFLLMVSTIEPRKNHRRLLEAWEVLRDRVDKNLKLVFVGHVGWDYKELLDGCETWIEQGSLFMLQNVPSDVLRILYRQALVTVCPSVGEGFDFSGIEAMRCGGVVAASDIPVHREVYGDAADYFDPYDTGSLVASLQRLISDADAVRARERLRELGVKQSEQYLPENILPQWADFLSRIR